MRLALLLSIASVVGCYDPTTPYPCTSDQNCINGPRQGSCTPGGGGVSYCAYPDSNCGARLRWSGDAIGAWREPACSSTETWRWRHPI